MKTLDQCFETHGADKCARLHGYSRHYEPLFEPMRHEPISLLEIGVYQGASIRAWLEYFGNASIYGLDISPMSIVLEHARYTQIIGDQTDAPLLTRLAKRFGPFNIILDDASHLPQHQAISFEALWPHLSPSGLYVIEDTHPAHDPLHGSVYHHGAQELLWRIVSAINWHGCKYHGRPFPSTEPTADDLSFGSLTIHRGLLIIRKAQ